MTWILTSNGDTVDVRLIKPDQLDIEVIAHSLSTINRFTGHALRPISVAEHSILVSHILEREQGIDSPSVLLAGLMREAHKSITGDLSWAMQQLLGPVWAIEEGRIQFDVMRHFNLISPWQSSWGKIGMANQQALACERLQLLPEGGPVWPCTAHQVPAWVKLADEAATWSPDDWRQAFLARFNELDAARRAQHTTPSA